MDVQKEVHRIGNIIAKHIKMARLYAGLSQQDIGDALNLSFQQIQKYETGKDVISAKKLWIISILTKHPITYFFNTLDQEEVIENISTKTFLRMIRIYKRLNSSQQLAFSAMMDTVAEANEKQ